MLRLPVVGTKQPDEVILKEISLLVLVETAEDSFQHVFVDHETREDIIGSRPLIKCSEDQPLISLRNCSKGLRE